MRMLKRTACWLLAWLMVLGLLPTAAMAAGSVMLAATLSSGRSVTFYPDSTIADVKAALGEPKIETVSRYGGNAYSFYGDDYQDYFYFESTADGRIALYTVIGRTFTSPAGNSGVIDPYGYPNRTLFKDRDDRIWGAAGICGSLSSAERTAASEAYAGDAAYAEAIARHAAAMWNAVAAFSGKSGRVAFDSRTFYLNRQLLENGSSLYDYCRKTGREDFSLIQTMGGGAPYSFSPNPLFYARHAGSYTMPEGSYLVCDICGNNGVLGALRSSFYLEAEDVPLTAEEEALIRRLQQMSKESLDEWNSGASNTFLEAPDLALPLRQGVLNPALIKGAVKFLNMVRVGAGLPELAYSPELSDKAQCKAVLISYLNANDPSNAGHDPSKPAGVDDELYEKSKPTGGENLYMGNPLTSIINALDDRAGDPISCGHRENLLDPFYTSIGIGYYGGQSAHQFESSRSTEAGVDVVAWPSKGIALADAMTAGTHYTVAFYNGMKPTASTGVRFHCLNTDQTIVFESGLGQGTDRGLVCGSGQVTYYDRDIALRDGCVYEITVTNVDDGKGNVSDYTYRSVYVMISSVPGGDTTLTLSDSSLSIQEGERRKINASILPEDTANKLVTWSSDDESVASVTGNGIVTGKAVGTAEITARMENGIAARCAVSVREADPVRLGAGGVSTASGKISFTASVDNSVVSAVSGTLYAAAYRDGRLSAVQSLPVQLPAGGRTEQAFSLSGQTAKLFFLDSRTLLPLTVPKEVG